MRSLLRRLFPYLVFTFLASHRSFELPLKKMYKVLDLAVKGDYPVVITVENVVKEGLAPVIRNKIKGILMAATVAPGTLVSLAKSDATSANYSMAPETQRHNILWDIRWHAENVVPLTWSGEPFGFLVSLNGTSLWHAVPFTLHALALIYGFSKQIIACKVKLP
nr:chaperonin-60 beta4 [Tanacetum cinerariifolium]